MGSTDPILRELFDRGYRLAEESKTVAAERHAIIVDDLERAHTHREQVKTQYAELERTVTTGTERFVRSEKIFVDAMSEMTADMRKTRERLDEIGGDTGAYRETLLAILDRLQELRG